MFLVSLSRSVLGSKQRILVWWEKGILWHTWVRRTKYRKLQSKGFQLTCVDWPMAIKLRRSSTAWRMDWCEKTFGLFQSNSLPIHRCAAQKSHTDHRMASREIPIGARKSHSRIYSWLPLVIHARASRHYTNCTLLSLIPVHLGPWRCSGNTHTHSPHLRYLQWLQTVGEAVWQGATLSSPVSHLIGC